MSLPDRIGRHRVLAQIGTGAFGVVVRAHDESLQDVVAIKILADHWSADEEMRERFVEEARLLRRTSNAHLVSVHDIGELADGRPYFVMEYANRGTLAGRIQTRGAAGLDRFSANLLATSLAAALTALHRLGIVHRDVNPRNLFLSDQREDADRSARAVASTRIGAGLIASSERVLLGDLGLAKNLVRAGPAVSVIGGTPRYQAPEQMSPLGAVAPTTDIYSATAVFWAAITGEAPPEPHELPDHVTVLEQRWRPWFERGMAVDPADRFPDVETWLEALQEAIGDEDVVTPAIRGRGRMRETGRNPYQGLAAFQPEDASRFFGRGELVKSLIERLSVERVLVVGGASGSGKSSLIRAGLIPRLAAGALEGSDRWPIALFTPRSDPIQELAYQLERAARHATQQELNTAGPAEITSDPLKARAVAERATDSAGGMLMVVDQFEELFTQTASTVAHHRFLEILSAIVDPVDSHVRLVLILRADFYSQSALYPWLAEKINRNQILVGPMSRSELRAAIEEPARQLGMRVEEGLVDAVLDEATSQSGALPLVSHALAETWRRRTGSLLSVEGYRTAGGVARAIAQTAETVYERFDEPERETARHLLLRMISPGDASADTRQSLPNEELTGDLAPELARKVAADLTAARLLTVDREVISIAHEALIRSWPRLRQWIDENRDDLRTRQRISAAAADWEGQDRNPDLLYRGTQLSSALEWAATHRDDLGSLAQEFLADGRSAHEQEIAATELADKRSRRLRNATIAVLAILLSVAVVASIIGFTGFNQATERLASGLATQASDLADENPRLALALAVEAVTRGANTFEARDALVTATRELQSSVLAPAHSPTDVGDALTIAMHPSGGYFAVASRPGEIHIYDAAGNVIGDPLLGHSAAVEEIVFTPDGRRMITGGQDGALLVWDMGRPDSVPQPTLLGQSETLIWGLAAAEDGRKVASASEDGVVQVWDLQTGAPIGAPLFDSSRDVLSVQFSPRSDMLLVGNGRGELMGWNLDTGDPAFTTFNAHGSDLWEIVFSPLGDLIATASSDGRIRLWDLTGRLIAEPFDETTSDVRGVQFLADGRSVVAGDQDGRLRVWDIDDGTEVFVSPTGHGRQILDIGISADGAILVTIGLDQQANVWTSGASAVRMTGHDEGAFGLAVSPKGDLLASGDGRGSLRLFEPTSGTLLTESLEVHDSPVWALVFSDDGERLFSGDTNGNLAVMNVATGETMVDPLPAHDGAIRALASSGDRVFSAGDDGFVRVWDTLGVPVGEPLGPHAGGSTALTFAGRATLVVADRAGTIHFWDPETSNTTAETLTVEDNTIWGVDASPDGDLLAAASDDWTVLVWDLVARSQLRSLTPHPDGATGVGFLEGGVTLATSSRDGSVRLFDVASGREFGATPGMHTGPIWSLVVFPDGVRYATSSEDGSVRIWDELDLDAACARVSGAFDGEQQRRYLGEVGEAVGCS